MPNTKSHSILIVADAFGKPSYAPRLRSLCDYLIQKGWSVEVYTEQFIPLTFAHDYPIYECPLYKNHAWDWAIKTAWSLLTDWKNRTFSRWLKDATKEKTYDLVYCTTFSTFPLRAALEVAQTKQIPLHVDLRDIDEQAPNSQYQAHRQWWARPFRKWYREINIRRRNAVVRQAQCVTTVSPWHVQFLRTINPHIHLIYNGYDANLFTPLDVPSDEFILLYTGRIYESALQDPAPFIQAVRQLPNEMKLRIHWYTDERGKKVIEQLADQYGCSDRMRFFPYVPTAQIPALLHQCSIALVLSHKADEKGPHGIMTTKFFEALGVEKPVLCVPSDEACLAQVIQETNAGLAATDASQICAFIDQKYQEWKKNGFTRQAVNAEQQQRFTRQYQAQQFEQLFRQIIQVI